MWHATELLAALVLICVAQAAIDVAPHPARRALWSFLGLCAAFAVAIAVLSSKTVADPVVRLGIAVLIVYLLRWIITSAVDYLRGPFLMEPIRAADLAAAVEDVAGLAERPARRAARRILRDHSGETALLALSRLEKREGEPEGEFIARWQAACAPALEDARRIAAKFGGAKGEDRVSATALRFISQALCLYRRESVERVLSRLDGLSLARHSGRTRAGAELEKSAARNADMASLGLLPPADDQEAPRVTAFSGLALLWPALGLSRIGCSVRAWALGSAEALLLAYGLFAAYIDRSSWFVFLVVGILIHIQAAMALGDFALSTEPLQPVAAGEKKP